MASVDFMKLHDANEVKSKLRHCDKEERLKHEHSNLDINKSLTINNYQFNNVSYAQACRKYDEMIADLDKKSNSNKRKDRVTAFMLEIPCPEMMIETDKKSWFNKVRAIIAEQYCEQNIIADYVHVDEVHEYVDKDKGRVMSREHMHVCVVPEHEGKLAGKLFSSRENMIKLNEKIQEMTLNDYDMLFMTGSKSKGKRKVEELKRESMKREEELILQEKEALSKEKQALTREREEFTQEREKFAKEREEFNKRKADDIYKSFDAFYERNYKGTANNILKKLKSKDKEQEEYEQVMSRLQNYLEELDTQKANEIAILMQRAEMLKNEEKLEKREQFKEALKNKIEAGYEHSL